MPKPLYTNNMATDSGTGKKKKYPEQELQVVKPRDGITWLPKNTPSDVDGDGGGGYYGEYPLYNSPTAGSQYSYTGERPTWSWDREAPTWQWDDSVRPNAFKWDEGGKPGDFSYKDAPVYDSRYDPNIQALAASILNREAFSYDYNKDPLYAQYAEAYGRNGRNAMQDTLAQVSARTGGLASSYAGTAAQNTYNSYMQALNDKIPELQQIAYNMYRDEGNDMRSNLSMLQSLENMDYGRFQDLLSQYNTDRNLAYNVWNSNLDRYNDERNFAYQLNQDEWNRYYNDRNFNYGQYQDLLGQYNTDRSFSYGTYADALDQYNKDRSWDYNLWTDNLARTEAAAKAAYNSQVAAYNAARAAAQQQSAPASNNPGSAPNNNGNPGNSGTPNNNNNNTNTSPASLYDQISSYYGGKKVSGTNASSTSSVYQDKNGKLVWNGYAFDDMDALGSALAAADLSEGEWRQVMNSIAKNNIPLKPLTR